MANFVFKPGPNAPAGDFFVGPHHFSNGSTVTVTSVDTQLAAALVSGVLVSTPATMQSNALVDSTGGVASSTFTLVTSPATYTPATDEANNATVIAQFNLLRQDVANLLAIVQSLVSQEGG